MGRRGAPRRVGGNGILIGRQGDCDIVATDPQISRRHALIRLTSEGAEVVPLGRGPIERSGKESACGRASRRSRGRRSTC